MDKLERLYDILTNDLNDLNKEWKYTGDLSIIPAIVQVKKYIEWIENEWATDYSTNYGE